MKKKDIKIIDDVRKVVYDGTCGLNKQRAWEVLSDILSELTCHVEALAEEIEAETGERP